MHTDRQIGQRDRWTVRQTQRGPAAALLLACTGLACDGGRDPAWDRSRAMIGPVPLGDRVLHVDAARDRLLVIDLSTPAVQLHSQRVGRNPVFVQPAGDSHLAVLSRGEEPSGDAAEVPPGLWWLALDPPGTAPVVYPLDSPFDRVAIAEDRQRAVCYFSPGGTAGGVFRNPSEVAVIDLSRPPGPDNPVHKTLRSFGAAPEAILLSPPMTVPAAPAAEPRIFAVALTAGGLTVFDASHPERREVSLRLGTTDTQVIPRDVRFVPGAGRFYVRSERALDVLEVALAYEPPEGEPPLDNDYQIAVAELGAGGGPADITVHDDVGGRRTVLAATPSTRELVLIDASAGQFKRVPLGDPVDRVVLAGVPEAGPARFAVLASLAQRTARVHIVDLASLAGAAVAVQTVPLPQPVADVVAIPGRDLVMLVHDDARTVLGLLDLRLGTVTPLQGAGRLDSYAFSADGGHLVGVHRGTARLGILDLGNLHPRDLRLDDLPHQVLALPGGSIYVHHADPLGRATIVPGVAAGRDELRGLSGFALTDLFAEELE